MPLALTSCLLLAAVSDSIGTYFCFAVSLGTSFLLFHGTRTWRDVILNVHYSIIFFFAVQFLLGEWLNVLFVIIGVVVGVLLNHPILEVLGWVGGPVFLVISCMSALLAEDHYYNPDWILEGISLFLVAIIVSCGLVSTGQALRKYRAYVSYYSRRLWASIRTLEGPLSQQEGDNLTRRLID